MLAKKTISAQETANALNKCSRSLNESVDIIKESISLSQGNLEGDEFEAIRDSLKKLIISIEDISNTTIPNLLTSLTNRVNEYNDSLTDEEGKKINTSRVNYNGSSTQSTSVSTTTPKGNANNQSTTINKIPNTIPDNQTQVSDNKTTASQTTNQNQLISSPSANDYQGNNSEISKSEQNNYTQSNSDKTNSNNQNYQSNTPNYVISNPTNFTNEELNQIFDYIIKFENIELNNNTIINYNNSYYKWEDIVDLIIKENNYNNYINDISISKNIITILTNSNNTITFNNITTFNELKNAIDNYIKSL